MDRRRHHDGPDPDVLPAAGFRRGGDSSPRSIGLAAAGVDVGLRTHDYVRRPRHEHTPRMAGYPAARGDFLSHGVPGNLVDLDSAVWRLLSGAADLRPADVVAEVALDRSHRT